MKTKKQISDQLDIIRQLRNIEKKHGLTDFQRGQLSGAQQALSWVSRDFLPITRAMFSEAELKEFVNNEQTNK